MLHQASHDMGSSLTDAPRYHPLAPRRHARRPPLLAVYLAAGAVGLASTSPLLREDLPIISADGDVAAVVGLWRDSTPILRRLEAMRGDVLLVTAVGGLVQ